MYCFECSVNRSIGESARTMRRKHMTHNMPNSFKPFLSKLPVYDKEGWPLNHHRSLIHKGRKRKLTRKDLYRMVDLVAAREDLQYQKEQEREERRKERNGYYDDYGYFNPTWY